MSGCKGNLHCQFHLVCKNPDCNVLLIRNLRRDAIKLDKHNIHLIVNTCKQEKLKEIVSGLVCRSIGNACDETWLC